MSNQNWVFDQTGFPMVWVDAINAYMHWLPVTKVQAEYFLCATPDSQYDERWYDDLLYLNPRVTPEEVHDNNYWNAFLTGILPQEAQRLAAWFGPQYSLPRLREWSTAYRALKELPELDSPVEAMGLADGRARTLIERVEAASRTVAAAEGITRTRADQMLMRLGVMEWVNRLDQGAQWGGMGKPARRFRGGFFMPDHGQAHELLEPESERASYYGLRLLRRA